MTVPLTAFYEFAVSGTDPSGLRHVDSHPSYEKELGAAPSGVLEFGQLNIDISRETPTKVVLWRVKNLEGNSHVRNMRFWISNIPTRIENNVFNMVVRSTWYQNFVVAEGSGVVPRALPDTQNVFRGNADNREEEFPHMSGTGDAEVSQWIYLNITGKPTSGVGRFGADGEGSLTYRMTFDYL